MKSISKKKTKEEISFHDFSINLLKPLQHPLSSMEIVLLFQNIYLHNMRYTTTTAADTQLSLSTIFVYFVVILW